MRKTFLHSLGPLLGLSLFAVALWVIHNELREYHYHDIVRHVRDLSIRHVSLGLGLTILNYLIMSGYDLLAIRYIHYQLPYRKIAMASFIGYAFSNNIGLSMLAGASVRYRLYSAWGPSAPRRRRKVSLYGVSGLIILYPRSPTPFHESMIKEHRAETEIALLFLLVSHFSFWIVKAHKSESDDFPNL